MGDTTGKYFLVLLYSMINTCIRSARVNILSPWVTLNVQDESKPLGTLNRFHAYEITLVANLYTWVDWWISVSMLLSQVDLIVTLYSREASGFLKNVSHGDIKNKLNISVCLRCFYLHSAHTLTKKEVS